MTLAPAFFRADCYVLRRITAQDLAFVQRLMADGDMHAHKPDPTLPGSQEIARNHLADLTHWEAEGFGRYLAFYDLAPIGLCGFSRRAGMAGLNLSYHVHRSEWGHGHASALVAMLVAVARAFANGGVPGQRPDNGLIYGLVRPANPASAQVLTKNGFTRGDDMILGGAPSTRYFRAI